MGEKVDKLTKIAFTVNAEMLKKLEELSEWKYRGSDRATTIRWLIEDSYEAFLHLEGK